jgi:hypothetical protein
LRAPVCAGTRDNSNRCSRSGAASYDHCQHLLLVLRAVNHTMERAVVAHRRLRCSAGSTEGGGLDAMFAGLPSVPNMSAAAAAPSAAAMVPAPAPMPAPTPAPMPTPTPAPMVAPIPAPVLASMPAAGSVSRTDQVEAQKHAKYAVSALQVRPAVRERNEIVSHGFSQLCFAANWIAVQRYSDGHQGATRGFAISWCCLRKVKPQ